MAQLQKLESQTFELKSCADKFFGFYKNNILQLQQLFPETYKSIQVLQGDGKSVGTVTLWKFVQENAPNDLVCKERLKVVDEKNRSITCCIFEGDLLNHYESFEIKLSVTPKGGNGNEGGCLVKWCIEYQQKAESVPPPKAFIDLLGKIAKGTDAHLLKKLESQNFELKCCADKFLGFYKNNILQLTELFPESYKSIQILEGDAPNDLVAKERLKAVDEKNRSITYCIFEGDLLNHYESFELKLSVTPKGGSGSGSAGGCLVKWCVEYQKKTEGVPPPDAFMDLMDKITKGTDAHLLKA